jgi:hypothetical protein
VDKNKKLRTTKIGYIYELNRNKNKKFQTLNLVGAGE